MLAIIGGTGLYGLEDFNIVQEKEVETLFGKPSAPLVFGEYAGQEVIFLPGHGKHHKLLPHEINYRANILA